MKSDKTRITIRIEKDLLAEFRKIFPNRGELTAFILRSMESVTKWEHANPCQIKKQIIGER